MTNFLDFHRKLLFFVEMNAEQKVVRKGLAGRKKAHTESMNTRCKQIKMAINEVRQLYDFYMTANDDNGESAGKSAEHYQARIEKEMDKIAKLQKAIVVLNEQHLAMQEDQRRIGMKPYAVVPAHHNVMLAVRELDNYYPVSYTHLRAHET